MSSFPKRLTEVFVTSDGKFHTEERLAEAHEARIRVHRAVRVAALAARHHPFGEYVRTDNEHYLNQLSSELVAAGLVFRPGEA